MAAGVNLPPERTADRPAILNQVKAFPFGRSTPGSELAVKNGHRGPGEGVVL